jgi:hypothetical protein
MAIWDRVRQSATLGDVLDRPVPCAMGLALALALASACAVAALFSPVYAVLGFIIGQLAIALTVQTHVLAQMDASDTGPAHLLEIILSPSEKRLLNAYRLFFLCPTAAETLAEFIRFNRALGVVWFAIAAWPGDYLPIGVIPYYLSLVTAIAAYYVVAQWAIVRLSPIAHDEPAAAKGDRAAQARLSVFLSIVRKRADAFGHGPAFPPSPGDEWGR